jgi:hypothetical protein
MPVIDAFYSLWLVGQRRRLAAPHWPIALASGTPPSVSPVHSASAADSEPLSAARRLASTTDAL